MSGHELGKYFFKEEVWGDILYIQDNVPMKYGLSIDKIVKIF